MKLEELIPEKDLLRRKRELEKRIESMVIQLVRVNKILKQIEEGKQKKKEEKANESNNDSNNGQRNEGDSSGDSIQSQN